MSESPSSPGEPGAAPVPPEPARDASPADAGIRPGSGEGAAPTPGTDAAEVEPAIEAAAPEAAAPAAGPSAPVRRDLTPVAAIVAFAIGCVLALALYVVANQGTLRAATEPKTWGAEHMNVARGSGKLENGTLVAQAPANDVLIVSVKTDLVARELSAVAWDVAGLPPGADVRLLFTSDYRPRRVQNRPLAVEDGSVLPAALAGDPDWLGRITGLAIAVRAPGATVRVRGVTVKSQGASQLVGDRAGEWFRFEPWAGTSINSVTGGAQTQSLPMPVPVSIAALIAFAALVVARRFAPTRFPRSVASLAVVVFVVAWAVLDVRWTANLARQVAETFDRYGGKDPAARALAAEDGDLVAFLDKAKALLPAEPQRVVVLAQAHYFRGRAGWHLLPHRVLWEPARDVPPPAGMLRPGDYVVVWQRPSTRFDPASGRLGFENGVEMPASLLLSERGAAVFAIH